MISEKKASKKTKSKFSLRLDFVAIGTFLLFSLPLGMGLWNSPQTPLRVIDFSWRGKTVGVQDRYFTLAFNRPVNRASVEQNLQIDPPLPGKISWIGHTMFYTLIDLPIYGIKYQLRLEGVKELNINSFFKQEEKAIKPYISNFSTRDLALAYIGIRGQEKGRLLLYNFNQKQKIILTPNNLIVTDFRIYPNGERILFSALDGTNKEKALGEQQLYTVTSGLNSQFSNPPQAPGKIQRVLDAKNYQNLRFELSSDGRTIVVQRRDLRNKIKSSLWVISDSGQPKSLNITGSKFIIAPDSLTVAVVQQQGIAVVPLTSKQEMWEFWSGYNSIIAFSGDGSQRVMVKFNQDSARSLFLVNNEGQEKELFRSVGSILDCQFEPRWEKTLYCLTTEVLPEGEQNREEPSLIAIDLETAQNFPLLALPNYKDVHIGISPDGLSLLFDQIVINPSATDNQLVTEDGSAIAAGLLWLLTIPDIHSTERINIVPPVELFPGFKPRWFP